MYTVLRQIVSLTFVKYLHVAASQKYGGDTKIWGFWLLISCQDNNIVWIICSYFWIVLSASGKKTTIFIPFISSRLADLKDFKKVNEIYAKCESYGSDFDVALIIDFLVVITRTTILNVCTSIVISFDNSN